MACVAEVTARKVGRRRSDLHRFLGVVVRTGHIAAAGITLGAVTIGVAPGHWPGLAATTGTALVADDLWRFGRAWLRFLHSWVIIAKVAALCVGVASPPALPWALWLTLGLGGLISHAPGDVRHLAFWGPSGPCATRGKRQATPFAA